ncbi:MAG TPA: transporter, partial [Microbacterium sp.]|nr:transporter [Microbacterium sp.]
MSTLLFSLGRWSYRHPWRVLTTWLLLLVVAGVSAVTFMAGTDNSFSIPGTEAQEGIVQLDRTFPQASGTSAQVLVAAPDAEAVTDDAYRTAIDDALSAFGDPDGVLA